MGRRYGFSWILLLCAAHVTSATTDVTPNVGAELRICLQAVQGRDARHKCATMLEIARDECQDVSGAGNLWASMGTRAVDGTCAISEEALVVE